MKTFALGPPPKKSSSAIVNLVGRRMPSDLMAASSSPNTRTTAISINDTMTVLADGPDEPTGLAAKDGTLYADQGARGQLLEIAANGVQ
jgi:hypothetical protein